MVSWCFLTFFVAIFFELAWNPYPSCVCVKHLNRCKTSIAGGSGPLMSPLPTKLLMSWEDIGTDHPDVPAIFNLFQWWRGAKPRTPTVFFGFFRSFALLFLGFSSQLIALTILFKSSVLSMVAPTRCHGPTRWEPIMGDWRTIDLRIYIFN